MSRLNIELGEGGGKAGATASCALESDNALQTENLNGLPKFTPSADGVIGTLALVAKCGPFSIYRLRCVYMRALVIRFLFIIMDNALWIWVGDQKEVLEDLEAAFLTNIKGDSGKMAVCTSLFSSDVEGSSSGLASKLAIRFKTPVFLSVNVAKADGKLVMFIQHVLQEQTQLLLASYIEQKKSAA
ncbi:hypothetical protein TGGT1_245650 [Toxoplasma gondii GT1]|uniref:Transmembrane protein n=3 Tax=Toxoplasma gondii TaxID=5811 RepID=S7V172_TOXGG|nr:hypothetical protein TGGT1_245650 [Toxoplasma gondii GT1]KAF4638419.1 hypothetical protein TGRH88_060270 [Toxoplasma gondii]RQX71898.1 putative transmembrane protein [Toxoplasma gondii CAST]